MKFFLFSAALAILMIAKADAKTSILNATLEKALPICIPPLCCTSDPADSISITEPVNIAFAISPTLSGYVNFPHGLTLCNIRGLLKDLCWNFLPEGDGIVFDGPVEPNCFGGSTPEYQTLIDAAFCDRKATLKDNPDKTDKASAVLDHPKTRVWGILLRNANGKGSLDSFCMEKPSVWFARLLIENVLCSSNGAEFRTVSPLEQCAIGSSMRCWFNYLWALDDGYTFILLVKAIVAELVKHINFDKLLEFMNGCDVPEEMEFYATCPITDVPRVEKCPVPIQCW